MTRTLPSPARIVENANTRRNDPVFGWANNNRQRREKHWCGEPNGHATSQDEEDQGEPFLSPSTSFKAAEEWTGE